MNKRKSSLPFYTVIGVIGVLAIGIIAFAYSGNPPKVIVEGNWTGNVEPDVNTAITDTALDEEKPLGSFPGPDIITDFLCLNGLCQAVRSGTMNDASTTIVSVLNPFGATSTVDYLQLNIDNGTTTALIDCGTSTVSAIVMATASTTKTLIGDVLIATSSYDLELVNGVMSPLVGISPDFPPGSASRNRIEVAPTEYVICTVSTTSAYPLAVDGWIQGGQIASGTYMVRFIDKMY